MGGIGLRDTTHANTSLLGKLIWSLVQDHDKLWVHVLSHRYLGEHSVLEVFADQNASPLWKGLLKVRDVLREGFSFRLGQGNTSLWFKDWSGFGALGKITPFIHISDSALTLADMVNQGQWDVSRLSTSMPQPFLQRLQSIKPELRMNIEDQ